MIKYIILMFSFLLMGCFGEKSSNTSTVSQSMEDSKYHTSTDPQSTTDSINPRIDRNNLYKPYPLYKDENSGAKLVVKQSEYSISKGDTVKYEILNLDNYELMVGFQFALEYWDGKDWISVPHGLGSVDIGLIVKKESHLSFSFILSEIERNLLRKGKSTLLKEGKYRIITGADVRKEKRTTNIQNHAVGKNIYLYAEFLLVG